MSIKAPGFGGGGGGGGGTVTRVAASTTIDLSVAGAGHAMPVIPGNIIIGTPTTLIPGAVADGGNNTGTYELGAALTLTGWAIVAPAAILSGTVIAAGNIVWITFVENQGTPTAIVNVVGSVSTTAPTFGTPSIANSTPGTIFVPVTTSDAYTLTGTTASVTLSGTNGGGKTINTVALISGGVNITFTPVAAYNDVIDVALTAGFVTDSVNGLSTAALSATLITNNINPPAPVFSADSPPTTGTVGTAYAGYTFVASNTTSFAVTAGSLPPGITLTGAVLAGTPTSTSGTFTVSAIGPGGTTAGASITITIAAGNGDTFNRANSTTSLGSPSDGGVPWVVYPSSGVTWGILSDMAYAPTVGADTVALRDTGSATIDTSISVTWQAGPQAGLVIRAIDNNNFVVFYPPTTLGGTTWTLANRYGSGYNTLDTFTGPATVAGTTYVLRGTAAANLYNVYVNGTNLGNVSSGSMSSATSVGMRTNAVLSAGTFSAQSWV